MPSESTIYQVCSYLRNFFFYKPTTYIGDITIVNGALDKSYGLLSEQFFCIFNSAKNDGVHQYPTTTLSDETFSGVIRGMSIPKAVIDIMDDIEKWKAEYNDVNSTYMSPYTSESIGSFYSYSKQTGGNADTSKDKSGTWMGTFAAALQSWRKI